MRALFRVLSATLVVSSIAGCTDEQDLVSPSHRRVAPASRPASRAVYASSPDLALLMVDVRGGDLQAPLRYDIVLKDGVSEAALPLPKGKGYEVTFRGYDRAGVQTHQGTTYAEYVGVGENKPLGLSLEPVENTSPGPSLEPDSKGTSVALEVGVRGVPRLEKGSQLIIESPLEEVNGGEPIHFSAYVIDPGGKRMDLDPGDFNWFIDDPRVDLFDPARPKGPQDDLNITSRAELLREIKVGVTVFDQLTVVIIHILWTYDPVIDISAGRSVTCSLRLSGRIECWGDDDEEMLGDGLLNQNIWTQCADFPNSVSDYRCVPWPVSSGGRVFSTLSVGGGHVCAIEKVTRAAFCWGRNTEGQLGPGISGWYVAAPTSPVTDNNGKTLAFEGISAGGTHTCGRTSNRNVFCWGANGNQQQGTWTTPTSALRYGAAAAGDRHTCALDDMGWVACAGDQMLTPHVYLLTLGRGPNAFHACGTKDNRDVICWGKNFEAQLGRPIDPDPATRFLPQPHGGVLMNGVALKADQVAAGALSTCALDQGAVFCWGSNRHGERGDGTIAPPTPGNGNPTPNRVAPPAGQSFERITAGDRHVCGVVTSGSIYCWGANERGQLGIGQTRVLVGGVFINAVPTPMKVVGT